VKNGRTVMLVAKQKSEYIYLYGSDRASTHGY